MVFLIGGGTRGVHESGQVFDRKRRYCLALWVSAPRYRSSQLTVRSSASI
jgi:hypothetical protein